MIELKDAIIINMLKTGEFQGATLTVKGLVGANIVAARCALQTLRKPLTQENIDDVIAFLKEAESVLEYLKDVDE